MLWLFGEIWLWLLIAFVLGGAIAAFVLFTGRRDRVVSEDGGTSSGTARGETAAPRPPEPSDVERTQQIRRVEPQLQFGQRTPGQYPSPQPRPTPNAAPDEGRRQGVLPVSPSEWHARNEWPNEHDTEAAEEDRPRREG